MSDPYDLETGPDPATLAAAEPEPDGTPEADGAVSDESATGPTDPGVPPVYAVGIGPGNPEYLTPRARRAVREADVVVGFETVRSFLTDAMSVDAEVLSCGYRDEADTLAAFADRVADGAAGTAVLMGDPNHSGYQFVGKVQSAVDRPVRVIPGISSLQIAASRARTPMEATTFVTLHKSGDVDEDLARLRDDVGDRHLLVLPRPFDLMPEDVAADLLETADADPSLEALVLERLTHPDEQITRTTLGELAAARTDGSAASETGEEGSATSTFSDLSVLVVRAPIG
ncbi:precorrin-6Y C5,15-methyltransferase (decarboxylating) [Halopenitus malekzadehii]|uniref:Precorrin-6Y C5,15-methyltransferase (Decarboxylating) n=1 Tax=Halopenitus malekzadehii TaxID=1267564 RepID=A0A1H6I1H1_9EURY|nr:cobalt-precorrin-7 (C(5))-methyltransferase [Halopenitus malekzadehii]SEH40365.1 precorrin-6Y C5,15-methyltransferase (decarboxylating) [Halopenitus malekzadehii]